MTNKHTYSIQPDTPASGAVITMFNGMLNTSQRYGSLEELTQIVHELAVEKGYAAANATASTIFVLAAKLVDAAG